MRTDPASRTASVTAVSGARSTSSLFTAKRRIAIGVAGKSNRSPARNPACAAGEPGATSWMMPS
jgi:hypothetical protein